MRLTDEQRDFLSEKVREFHSKGLTQREIASTMQCSLGTVNNYLQQMRKEARDNIRTYVDVTLVNDFSRINIGLEQIIKNSW